MRAELLAIGSELTSGHTVNTNAAYLARRLQDLGIACARQTVVGDDRAVIVQTLKELLGRTELLVITGGLGPTFDDLTLEAIATAAGRRLVLVPWVARRIGVFYRRAHRRISRLALRQASIPAGGVALPNPVGTAPGLWLPVEGTLVIALPGVPQEMRTIMERSVVPRLARQRASAAIVSRTIRTAGLVELQIQAILPRLAIPGTVQVGLYPHLRMVDIRLTVSGQSARRARQLLDRLECALRRRLKGAVYGVDDETLEAVVGEAMVRRRHTLAIAESCTGGLISDRLTNVSGSSRYLRQSLVAYHNRAKAHLLGVSPALLARAGAVSGPVAQAMAEGVRRLANAQIGLAVTGIAGPTGATARKPVGLVYLAIADRRAGAVRRCQFHGDRLAIKHQAAQAALDWLRRWILKI